MDNYKSILKHLRRYTGDAFTSSRGYDLRKPLNFGQRMAVKRYGEKLQELLSKPHIIYKPKRGEKTAAFEYTGQSSFRKFQVAFIEKWNEKAQLEMRYDRRRPAGSRFYTVDKRPGSGQAYYIIPASILLNQPDHVIKDILEYYAPDCELFLIRAGESYIWGAAGTTDGVSKRIVDIFQNYGASFFDANDKNSSYYGNWFHGVVAFTHRQDAYARIHAAAVSRREFMDRRHVHPDMRDEHYREMKDGSWGRWKDGHYMGRAPIQPPTMKGKREVRRMANGRYALYINDIFISYVELGEDE